MTDFEKYNLYVSGAAALGTIILAIVAIFGGWIRRFFIKPKIDMTISKSKPYVELVRENNPNESDETKFKKIHLKIGNKGRQTAINSQLLVEKVFKKRGDNQTYYLDKSFIPCNFLWFNEKESKPVTSSISHFIEIARIQRYQEFSSDVEEEGQPVRNRDMYRLWLSIENNSKKGTYLLLGKGTFLFPIVYYSDSLTKPIRIYIEIFWNCDSLEEMNDSTFYIKKLKESDLSNDVKNEL